MSDEILKETLPREHRFQWTNEAIGRFWDFESRYPERYFTCLFGSHVIGCAKPYLEKATNVLDYGAGAGFVVRELLRRNRYHVCAIDHSPESVRKLAERFAGNERFRGAFLPENCPSGDFDFIFLIETIEHLEEEDLREMFEHLRRLLKPTGHLLVTTPYRENLEKSMVCCPDCAAVFHRWQHVRSWDESSLANHLKRYGFDIKKMETRDFFTHPLRKVLNRIRRVFSRSPASLSNDSLKLVAICSR